MADTDRPPNTFLRAKLRLAFVFLVFAATSTAFAGAQPIRARQGIVVSASTIASQTGAQVLRDGGNAVDAAIATAFALAVTHPTAGNIGGGGFLVYRSGEGVAEAYDFRETAPAAANEMMFLKDGKYDAERHHRGHRAVGVPGTVAGLHMAWRDHGKLPWARLVAPAIKLARDGFVVSIDFAESLRGELDAMRPFAASISQFSKNGTPYRDGEVLKQGDLARTLERIAAEGPAGFYRGETARLIEKEMRDNGGLITRADLAAYQARKREPVRGSYRGYEILSMPPPSSGGVAIIEALNILEGYDLRASGYGSAQSLHSIAEAMRRAFADRAANLGDPDFNPQMPLVKLMSKDYARQLRAGIDPARASVSSPATFTWPAESRETTHLSVVDAQRNAVSLTYTLEYAYGSHIVVSGGGFLLNNEMGDFNAGPGITTAGGLVGTQPNLAAPGKRMLSSMSPTIVTKDGKLFMVTGSPGGSTIISTVLLTLLNVIDFGMSAQDAVDAGRIHHQWLPDRINFERNTISPDTRALLTAKGHVLKETEAQGLAEVIISDNGRGILEAGVDQREADGGAAVQDLGPSGTP